MNSTDRGGVDWSSDTPIFNPRSGLPWADRVVGSAENRRSAGAAGQLPELGHSGPPTPLTHHPVPVFLQKVGADGQMKDPIEPFFVRHC